jgi:hypothetical protein
MKIVIILVLLCAVTTIKVQNKESVLTTENDEEITAFILSATQLKSDNGDGNVDGPYKIKFTPSGNGLLFTGLTAWGQESGKKYLQAAFSEANFNKYFVKNGNNFMIPYRFFKSGSTQSIGNRSFKWEDFTLKNDDKETISFRIQNQYRSSGTVWNQERRGQFINGVTKQGTEKRIAAGSKVTAGRNASGDYFTARTLFASAGMTKVKLDEAIKLQKVEVNSQITALNVEANKANDELLAAKEAENSAQNKLNIISSKLTQKNAILELAMTENYKNVVAGKTTNEAEMNKQFAAFNTQVEGIKLLTGPSLGAITTSLTGSMKAANDARKSEPNPEQNTINEEFLKIYA